MTFDDVKKAVKELNIFPAQLFSEDDLKQDRVFGKVFDQVVNTTKEIDDYKKQITDKENEIKKLTKDITLATATEKLKKAYQEGLTSSQKTFIEKRFKPETMEDLSEDKLKVFIDNSLKEFSEYATIFTPSENNSQPQKDEPDDKDSQDEIDKIVDEVIKQPQGE